MRRRFAERLPEPLLRWLFRVRHAETPLMLSVRRTTGRIASRATGVPAREFDADEVARRTAADVAGALDQHNVPYVAVPGQHETVRALAVSTEHRGAAWRALAVELAGPEWVADLRIGEVEWRRGRVLGRALPAKATGAVLYRVLTAADGRVLADNELGCDLDFWEPTGSGQVRRKDGGVHLPGTFIAPRRNGVVAYLTPEAWSSACSEPSHWVSPKRVRSIFEFDEPIDLVYTWVDGDDPAWLAHKAAYHDDATIAEVNESAAHRARFQSRDELRFSLRSVGMYASWVRHIFIVTDGQVPPWLNTHDPQVTLVDHREIFTDPDVLPVFNSHAIESQLHHIDGLSEHYLYLNDDFFFGRPVQPELFFHGNGIAKFFLSKVVLDVDPPSRRDLPVLSAAKQNRALLERDFGVTASNKFMHTPQPQLRSVVTEMERRHPEVFAEVARSRFRHPNDLSIPSALAHYYAYSLGKAVPGEISYRYQDTSHPDTQRRLELMMRKRDADVFCLNDAESDADDSAEQMNALGEFLATYYPYPSRFERT